MSNSDGKNLFQDSSSRTTKEITPHSSQWIAETTSTVSTSTVSTISTPTSNGATLASFSNYLRETKMFYRNNHNGNNNERYFILESKLFESMDTISLIGFRHLIDTNRTTINRIFWAILVLLSIGLAVYQIDDRIDSYESHPTTTEVDVVSSQVMNFPQVTICNDNYIKLSSAAQLGLVDYFKQFMPPYVIGPMNVSHMIINKPKITNQSKLIELKKFLSPGLEQIVQCRWNNGPCPREMIEATFTDYGQCLYLNSRKWNLTVTRPGATLGLEIILNANQSDYFVQQTASAGFTVLLHEPEEPPRMVELGFKISLGQGVNVAVSVTNITRSNYPVGACIDNPEYHPVKCEWKCLAVQIVMRCECRPIYMAVVGNESICDYYEEQSCVDRIINDFYRRKSNGSLECSCNPLCNEITFQSSVTGSSLSKNYVDALNQVWGPNVTYREVAVDQTILTIYLSSLQYTKMTTRLSYSFMALLSDLGGALGLLSGATFLTVVEGLELIYDLLFYMKAKREVTKNKKSVEMIDQKSTSFNNQVGSIEPKSHIS